jgi:hypothetical protein
LQNEFSSYIIADYISSLNLKSVKTNFDLNYVNICDNYCQRKILLLCVSPPCNNNYWFPIIWFWWKVQDRKKTYLARNVAIFFQLDFARWLRSFSSRHNIASKSNYNSHILQLVYNYLAFGNVPYIYIYIYILSCLEFALHAWPFI